MIDTNKPYTAIDGCFTKKTIEALKPILKSLEVIDQVEELAKKLDEEIEVLELFLETYKNMEKT